MYDCIIVGGGPAGLTAAIYLLRSNKKVIVLEKETIGGQISRTSIIENYPGFKKISGVEFSNNLFEQVLDLGGEIELEEVIRIEDGDIKKVITDENIYESKTIIMATGTRYRLLGLDNEMNLIGSGISFCVNCDAAFFKGKITAVIGGGNTAIINALTLSDICKKVYLIHRRDSFKAELKLINNLKAKDNIEILYNSKIIKINGDDNLESIDVETNNKVSKIDIDGLFISIGQTPETKVSKDLLQLNNEFIIGNDDCSTNVSGIFVAGDCRDKKIRQLTTAVNDGTIAALSVNDYLNNI